MRNDFTATGCVLNAAGDKILLIFHKKLNKWLPPGGHVDPNEMPQVAAVREVLEETGVAATIIEPGLDLQISAGGSEAQMPTPLCVLHEFIPANSKDVAHMHYDFIYLMRASEGAINQAEHEVSDARWFLLSEINALDTTEGCRRICAALAGYKNNCFKFHNKSNACLGERLL